MIRRIIILLFLGISFLGNTQEESVSNIQGGLEVGLSSTKLFVDTLDTKRAVMPLFGFGFQKQLIPKFYVGFSSIFTQKNSSSISPSLKHKLNFIDWRLGLMFKPTPKLFLEGGVAVSQFLGGKVKFSNGTEINQDNNFLNQINPYVGLRYVLDEIGISAKYYLPTVLTNPQSFAQNNQFSYAEMSMNISFDKLNFSKEKTTKEIHDEEQAKRDISALKSGILLVVLSGVKTKEVIDNDIDKRLVEAMKNYGFSKYFVVDQTDIFSLKSTNKIAVYENYPFSDKQTINLENFEWYLLKAEKTNVAENEALDEDYLQNTLVIYNKNEQRLSAPFPYFINFTKSRLDEAIKSLNSNLERYYYEASFGM